jgi:dipeptidyl aminopeptidase/acylaminoacyl peptidase
MSAPLFLVHGRNDPAVPYTEALRLRRAAEAAGRPVRVAIVGAVGHVDPEGQATAGEIARLWATVHAFAARSAAADATSGGRAP